ncbi:MAG: DUF1552 domain-containing protein [Marinagarivorans sp.]|nr:DUF1552 domain-containing protein [Marinagarivorans sp.]
MSQIELRRNKAPKLDRRSFLAGSGVCLSLPLLEAMLPTGKTAFAQSATPTRMLTFFTGNGCHMQTFQPTTAGDHTADGSFRGASSLAPLKDLWQDVTTIKGLNNDPMRGQTGDHGKGSGAFMTCDTVQKNTISSRITMDVVAANSIGSQTRFSNLHLGLDKAGTGFPDNGFSAAYMGNISWINPNTPVPKEVSPQNLFNKLFGGTLPTTSTTPTGTVDTRSVVDRSVLDAVLADVNRLQNKLGTTDKEKLQGYLEGVRDLEKQLAANSAPIVVTASCKKPTIGANGNFVTNSRLMNDLMVMAFTCDLTRIISYMFSNGLTGRAYSNLGISGGHHSISHHGSSQSNYTMLKKIDTYHMEELADLCKKLKAQKDVQGKSLLDSTIVFYSSEIADGNSHSHYNLPVVLVGKGNGVVKSGRHMNIAATNMANLYLTMMKAVGANVNSFTNSTGALSLV